MNLELFINGKSKGWHDLPKAVAANKEQFRLEEVRKGGGNGLVVQSSRLRDGGLVSRCAVKFLRKLDQQSSDRFDNEIRVMKELVHSNIAGYYGSGTVKLGQFEVKWMAQELGDYNLRQTIEFKGKLPTNLIPVVATQMCNAVEHLHSKEFIHRDIKPDNFVWAEGSKEDVLMIDFGLAKQLKEDVSARPLDQFTRTMEFVGPVFYSSPELIEYAKNKKTVVDHRSDIFQVGKTVWYLATGKVSAGIPSKGLCPFGGKLRELVMAMIDDDPSSRPQTIAEVKAVLSEF